MQKFKNKYFGKKKTKKNCKDKNNENIFSTFFFGKLLYAYSIIEGKLLTRFASFVYSD